MRNYRKLFNTAVASASILGTAVLVGNFYLNSNREKIIKASWTNTYEPSVKWDNNWDRREHVSSIHPKYLYRQQPQSQSLPQLDLNNNNKPAENSDKPKKTTDDFDLNKHTSKATRHLFLIRHGQYEIREKDSSKHVLTPLGN